MKQGLLATGLGVVLTATIFSPGLGAAESKACETAYRQAVEEAGKGLSQSYSESENPIVSAYKRAAHVCRQEAQLAEDTESRALATAHLHLSEAFQARRLNQRDRAYEIAEDGVKSIRSWASDRHPALVPLLKELADLELALNHDGKAARRYLEEILDIQRETYGEHDGRVAEALFDLAVFYMPTEKLSGSSSSWADAETARDLFEEALKVRLENPDGPGLDFERLTVMMIANYEEMGEKDRGAELQKTIEALKEELAVTRKLREQEQAQEQGQSADVLHKSESNLS